VISLISCWETQSSYVQISELINCQRYEDENVIIIKNYLNNWDSVLVIIQNWENNFNFKTLIIFCSWFIIWYCSCLFKNNHVKTDISYIIIENISCESWQKHNCMFIIIYYNISNNFQHSDFCLDLRHEKSDNDLEL